MRTQILLASLLCASAVGFAQQKSGQLANITRITNDADVKYENPRFSPDGSKVAFTKFGYEGLYVAETTGEKTVSQINTDEGVGYMFQWSADGAEILCRKVLHQPAPNGFPRTYNIQSVDINSKVATKLSDDEGSELRPAAWRYNSKGEASVVADGRVLRSGLVSVAAKNATLNANNFKEVIITPAYKTSFITDFEHLWAVDQKGAKKIIFDGPALCPALSPDGKQVAFCDMESNVLVMSVKGGNATVIGKGFNPSWVNNDQIVVEQTADNGHEYTAGDLHMLSVKDKSDIQLTRTPGRIEMNPCVSPDGKKITFTSFDDGQVYIADFE